MDAQQFQQIRTDIAGVLSAIKARHTLLGITVLLIIQQSCIEDTTNRAVKRELANVPVCTSTQTGK